MQRQRRLRGQRAQHLDVFRRISQPGRLFAQQNQPHGPVFFAQGNQQAQPRFRQNFQRPSCPRFPARRNERTKALDALHFEQPRMERQRGRRMFAAMPLRQRYQCAVFFRQKIRRLRVQGGLNSHERGAGDLLWFRHAKQRPPDRIENVLRIVDFPKIRSVKPLQERDSAPQASEQTPPEKPRLDTGAVSRRRGSAERFRPLAVRRKIIAPPAAQSSSP